MMHHAIAGELDQLAEHITRLHPGDGVGRDQRSYSRDFHLGYATALGDAALLATDRAAELRSKS